jgi:hypothetical protein
MGAPERDIAEAKAFIAPLDLGPSDPQVRLDPRERRDYDFITNSSLLLIIG